MQSHILFHALLSLAAIGISAAPGAGQGPGAAAPSRSDAVSPESAAPSWRVPIHTLADDPVGGRYGVWAGGASFKTSFHDGFAFYPYLGPDHPEHLPLRWHTESVTAGEQVLLEPDSTAVEWHDEWRFERRYGLVTERYDVRADGVEQSFVVRGLSSVTGDLVVTGRIDTPLRAATTQLATPAAISFAAADGAPLVRYGAAVAFDASGRRTAVATRFDGQRLQLVVPGSWLADAVGPVTVDPLIERVVVDGYGGGAFGLPTDIALGVDRDFGHTQRLMTCFARQFTSSDFDVYAVLSRAPWGFPATVFTDITSSWSTRWPSVQGALAPSKWVIAVQREFSNTIRVRVYVHPSDDNRLNVGRVLGYTPSSAEANRYPVVTGDLSRSAHSRLVIVYQSDVTATKADTPNSVIHVVAFDASAETFASRFEVDSLTGDDDCQRPHAIEVMDDGISYVTYERRRNDLSNALWQVRLARVSTYQVTGNVLIGGASATHSRLRPRVAGQSVYYDWNSGAVDGELMVTWQELRSSARSDFGESIRAQRVTWPVRSAAPTLLPARTIASDLSRPDFVNFGLAHDVWTNSHWAAVYQRGPLATGDTLVARLGSSAGVVESATVYSGPDGSYSPAVTYNVEDREFGLAYASNSTGGGFNLPVTSMRLVYPYDCGTTRLGSDCGFSITDRDTLPLSGNARFVIRMGAYGPPTYLLLSTGLAATPIRLGSLGFPSCELYLDPSQTFYTEMGTGILLAGTNFVLPLPDSPPLNGNLYVQGYSPSLGTTAAMELRIR